MKKMKNARGFTMMEMLVAVAILVILMGIGFVGVQQYQRRMKQIELDETARSIFIAAQNHLSVAASQGVLQKRDVSSSAGWAPPSGGDKNYYFVQPNDGRLSPTSREVLYDMLPRFSIDDTVRLGGSYVIEYDLGTATVTNVFYSDQSSLSTNVFSQTNAENLYNSLFGSNGYIDTEKDDRSDKRLNGFGPNNAILGYYGGKDAASLARVKLYAPRLVLSNDECLEVKVSLPSASLDNMREYDPYLELFITGKTSKNTRPVTNVQLSEFMLALQETVSGNSYLTLSFILDDITAKDKSFYNQFCSYTENNLIPGEDVKITARIQCKSVLGMVERESNEENSLFSKNAIDSNTSTPTNSINIANMRHLENLDPRISGYNPKSFAGALSGSPVSELQLIASQLVNLRWVGSGLPSAVAFLDKIVVHEGRKSNVNKYLDTDTPNSANKIAVYDKDGNAQTSGEGTYVPVNPKYDESIKSFTYDGCGNTIENVRVNTSGEAGLFGKLETKSELKKLQLVNFNVTSTGNDTSAGALLGSSQSNEVKIDSVLAYHTSGNEGNKITGKGSCGGLVGKMSGGSVSNSAAALYVESESGNAGGLIGQSEGTSSSALVKIENSYSGGHTDSGKYVYDSEKGVDNSAAGHMNVIGSVAGGLVGNAKYTQIKNSYTTCSAFGNGFAGGFIGSTEVGGVDVINSYCTGRVETGTNGERGAFIGNGQLANGSSNNWYLKSVNDSAVNSGTESAQAADDSTETYIDSTETYIGIVSDLTAAKPYDEYLRTTYGSKYFYKTIRELDGSAPDLDWLTHHYGDWPAVETWVVNTPTSNS